MLLFILISDFFAYGMFPSGGGAGIGCLPGALSSEGGCLPEYLSDRTLNYGFGLGQRGGFQYGGNSGPGNGISSDCPFNAGGKMPDRYDFRLEENECGKMRHVAYPIENLEYERAKNAIINSIKYSDEEKEFNEVISKISDNKIESIGLKKSILVPGLLTQECIDDASFRPKKIDLGPNINIGDSEELPKCGPTGFFPKAVQQITIPEIFLKEMLTGEVEFSNYIRIVLNHFFYSIESMDVFFVTNREIQKISPLFAELLNNMTNEEYLDFVHNILLLANEQKIIANWDNMLWMLDQEGESTIPKQIRPYPLIRNFDVSYFYDDEKLAGMSYGKKESILFGKKLNNDQDVYVQYINVDRSHLNKKIDKGIFDLFRRKMYEMNKKKLEESLRQLYAFDHARTKFIEYADAQQSLNNFELKFISIDFFKKANQDAYRYIFSMPEYDYNMFILCALIIYGDRNIVKQWAGLMHSFIKAETDHAIRFFPIIKVRGKKTILHNLSFLKSGSGMIDGFEYKYNSDFYIYSIGNEAPHVLFLEHKKKLIKTYFFTEENEYDDLYDKLLGYYKRYMEL